MVFKRTFNMFNTKGVQGPVNITAIKRNTSATDGLMPSSLENSKSI